MNLDLDGWLARRSVRMAIWTAICVLSAARFFYLAADFPNWSPWMIDQAKFTDEGWWASAAVMHAVTGHWYVAGDYNPAVALPVWPLLVSAVFHFTGVSVVAARALNVVISIATLPVVFALVRRYASGRGETPALVAVLLLASSPFAFVFSRLAILETLVVFEFCLALLAASYASVKRVGLLAAVAALVATMMLTKTTAVLLVPAIAWVAWSAMGRRLGGLVRAVVAVVVVPAALVKGYALLAAALGYGADYQYFFDVNAMPDIAWAQTLATLRDLFENGIWLDRVLYPVGLAILVLTVAWKRKLWANPLFAASWMVLAAVAVFIFKRQDDYAPRYVLVALAPLIWIVALTLGELMANARKTALLLLIAVAGAATANAVMIGQFLTHRDYDLHNAAVSIQGIVRSHPEQKPLLLGVSGPQIGLMTGIASINDYYGTEDGAEKIQRYQPGWYLAWNGIDPDNQALLAGYSLEKMASYPAFDDDDRTTLILYRMTPKVSGAGGAPVEAGWVFMRAGGAFPRGLKPWGHFGRMMYGLEPVPSWLVGEDLLDGGGEEAGQLEGQGQAGIETAGLNGVHGLAGDLEAAGEIGLAPVAFGAEDAKAVLHRFLQSWMCMAMRAVIQNSSMLSTGKRPGRKLYWLKAPRMVSANMVTPRAQRRDCMASMRMKSSVSRLR